MQNTILNHLIITSAIVLLIAIPSFGADIGLSVKGGYFHYSEPDADVSYSGLISGLQGDYQKSFSNYSFRLRSEFMSGNLSYDGQLNTQQVADGSIQISEAGGAAISYDSNLWYSDSAALLGKTFIKGGYTIAPYAGLGFRYLNNPENSNIGYDYARQITYVYLPLIVDIQKSVSNNHSWGLSGEVDILLHGSAKANLSDASEYYNDLQFDQRVGGALKLSGFYNRQVLGLNVSIKPFVDVWMVGDSDTDVLTYNGSHVLVRSANGSYGDYCEPANITMTAGLQLNILF